MGSHSKHNVIAKIDVTLILEEEGGGKQKKSAVFHRVQTYHLAEKLIEKRRW